MGLRRVLAAAAALGAAGVAAAGTAAPAGTPSAYLLARQAESGGFAEPGAAPTPGLTAWAVLGLRAAGVPAGRLRAAGAYLERSETELESATDLQLALLARAALGDAPAGLVGRVRAVGRGPTVSSAMWSILALAAAGERPPPATLSYLLRRQRPSGGWSWSERGAPDSNDTAAAIQALRAAGVRGRPVSRGLAFLRRLQNRDGGFELVERRGSDAQSTAWVIQAFVAAGARPPPSAFRYLERLRRPDGSYRYSRRYAVTPVWVTSQVLAALARRPLPIR